MHHLVEGLSMEGKAVPTWNTVISYYLWEGTAKAVDALEFDALERFWLFSRAESLPPASPPLIGWSPTALPAMRNLWCCCVNSFAVWIMMSHLHTMSQSKQSTVCLTLRAMHIALWLKAERHLSCLCKGPKPSCCMMSAHILQFSRRSQSQDGI